ncbi:MAG: hypothetical protein KDL87_13750, partial [Verrucomicrobiae bacterium]|nr:hypothetical protein [Verrucomicrobiae bacterium]
MAEIQAQFRPAPQWPIHGGGSRPDRVESPTQPCWVNSSRAVPAGDEEGEQVAQFPISQHGGKP